MIKPAGIHVVIPAFHEEDSLGGVLTRLNQVVHQPLRVSVVCDSFDDPTFQLVEQMRPLVSFTIESRVNEFGAGALNAIKTGLLHTTLDEAGLVVMADGCDQLEIVDEMWNQIVVGYDVVCGSRYMAGGRQIGGWWLKKLMSRGAGVSFHLLTRIGTHDITNSFKMYSSKVLSTVSIESVGGFEIGMEITIKAHRQGLKVTEIPTTWVDRTAGESRFRLRKWVPHYLRWYWKGLFPKLISKKSD